MPRSKAIADKPVRGAQPFLRFWPIFWSRDSTCRVAQPRPQIYRPSFTPKISSLTSRLAWLATTGRITSGTYNSIDLSTSMRNQRQTKARSPTIVLFVNKEHRATVMGRAGFSRCGRYRYWLRREWDNTLPQCAFIGLNPSTADAQTNDPTLRRCMDSPDNGGMDPCCWSISSASAPPTLPRSRWFLTPTARVPTVGYGGRTPSHNFSWQPGATAGSCLRERSASLT